MGYGVARKLALGYAFAHSPVACKTSVAKICLHIFMTECSRRRRRRQRDPKATEPIPENLIPISQIQ